MVRVLNLQVRRIYNEKKTYAVVIRVKKGLVVLATMRERHKRYMPYACDLRQPSILNDTRGLEVTLHNDATIGRRLALLSRRVFFDFPQTEIKDFTCEKVSRRDDRRVAILTNINILLRTSFNPYCIVRLRKGLSILGGHLPEGDICLHHYIAYRRGALTSSIDRPWSPQSRMESQ